MYLTNSELANHNQVQLHRLAGLFKNNPDQFYEVCNSGASFMNINTAQLEVKYTNRLFADFLERDQQEVVDLGLDLLKAVSDQSVMNMAIDKISVFNKTHATKDQCNYMQYMKLLGKWEWLYTTKISLGSGMYLNSGHSLNDLGALGRVVSGILGETLITNTGWLKFKSLSKREKEILKALAAGYTNTQLSEKLFLSEHTVRTHRKNIFKKLDLKSMRDVVVFAQTFEILDEL